MKAYERDLIIRLQERIPLSGNSLAFVLNCLKVNTWLRASVKMCANNYSIWKVQTGQSFDHCEIWSSLYCVNCSESRNIECSVIGGVVTLQRS